MPARGAAETSLDAAMRSLLGLVEALPELKASASMLALQEDIASTENRIALARQHYSDCALAYNTALGTVPSSFIARIFAFRPRALYESPAD